MASLRPFKALRPTPEAVEAVACPPYDVINTEEASELASGNPRSFLHVIRPEIDLPAGADEHSDEAYETGAANLKTFAASDFFVEDDEPALYIYRLIRGGDVQYGLYGLVSVADYDADVILKHEKTRPDKEDDRTRHILTQSAHAEPVMLAYHDEPTIDALVAEAAAGEPLYDYVAESVQHTIWRVTDTEPYETAFAGIANLYVADGHHRCKAASRAAAKLPENEEAHHFMAVLFPAGQMKILPYNRVIYRYPEAKHGKATSNETFLAALQNHFRLQETDTQTPDASDHVCVYIEGTWYELQLPPSAFDDPARQLAVSRLNEHVLAPLLDIEDPRRDPKIGFVGGIRGTAELERLVDSGKAVMAFSMYPTQMDELLAVSDAGLLMPPKSTWFEPKLRSGMLVHRF